MAGVAGGARLGVLRVGIARLADRNDGIGIGEAVAKTNDQRLVDADAREVAEVGGPVGEERRRRHEAHPWRVQHQLLFFGSLAAKGGQLEVKARIFAGSRWADADHPPIVPMRVRELRTEEIRQEALIDALRAAHGDDAAVGYAVRAWARLVKVQKM